MDATLADNGIVDQSALYEELEVPPEEQYIPAIHIHFDDDLTSKWLSWIYQSINYHLYYCSIIYRRMDFGRGIYSPTHLEAPHYSCPASTYTRLMKSSTRLHPERDTYLTHRTINDLEGSSMRKEWQTADQSVKQHMSTKTAVGKQTCEALRQQALNIQCGNLYVWLWLNSSYSLIIFISDNEFRLVIVENGSMYFWLVEFL